VTLKEALAVDCHTDLRDHNALVTGGESGLGLACARRLLQDGATVTIVGRCARHLPQAAADGLIHEYAQAA
jgi:NAD(P)-dependent dehydrogenase (short-subunit alcohol dehydrogenase family)